MFFVVAALLLSSAGGDPDAAQAKAAFERAERAYRVGDFDRALAEYQEAYRLYPRPEFLFNIGQAQRGRENWREAAFSFELYLAEVPNGPDAPAIRALIEDLERRAEEHDSVRPVAMPPPEASLPPPPLAVVPPPSVTDEAPPIYNRWWFWTAVGVVVLAGVTTAVVIAADANAPPTGSLGTFDYQ